MPQSSGEIHAKKAYSSRRHCLCRLRSGHTKRVLRYEGIGSEVAERFLCSAEPLSYYRDVIEEEYSATELSAKALAETKKPAKKGIPDELRKLFGE